MAAEPFAVEAPIPDIVGQAEALNDVSKKLPIPLTVNTENLPERFNAFMDGVAQYLEEYNEEYSEWFVDALPDLLNAYQTYTIDKDGETYQKAVEEFCDLAQQKMQQEGLENVMIAAREFDKAPEQLLKELYQNVEEFRLMNRVMTKRGEQYWFEDYEFERLSASIEDLRMDKQINVVALEKDFFQDIAKPLFVNHAVDRIVTVSTNYVNETNNFAFAHFVVLSQFYGSATILRELFVNAEKQRQEIVSLIRRSELIGNAVDIGDVTPDESVPEYQSKLAFLAYVLSAEEEFKTELDPLIPIDKTPASRQAAVYNALRKDYVLERDADALFERGRASLLYRLNYLLDLTQGNPEQSEHYANDKLYRDGYNVINDLVGKDNKTFLSVFVHRGIQVYLEMFIEDVADDIGPKDEASVLISELQVLQTAMVFHGIYEDPIYFDPDILDPEKNGEQFNLLITENIKMRLGESAFDLKLFREDAEAPENEKIGFWFEVLLGASGGLALVAAGPLTIWAFANAANAAKTVWKYIQTNVWAQRLIGATMLTGMIYGGVYALADKKEYDRDAIETLVTNTQVYWAKYTRGMFKDPLNVTPNGTFELNVTDYVNSAFYVMNATFVTKFGADLVTAYRKSSGNSLEQMTSKERSQSIQKAVYGWMKTMYNSSVLGIQSVLYAGYAFMTLDIYNFIRIGVVKIAGAEWIDAASGVILTVYQNSSLAEYAKGAQEMVFDQVISLLDQVYPSIRMAAYVGVPLVAVAYWASNAYGGNRQSKRLFQILGLQFILAFTASAIMNNDPLIGETLRRISGVQGPINKYVYSIDDITGYETLESLSTTELAIAQPVAIFALAATGIAFSQKLAGQVAKSFGSIRKSFAEKRKEALDAAILDFLRETSNQEQRIPGRIIDSDVDSSSWAAEAKQAALAAVAVRYDNSERLRQHLAKTYQSTVDEIKQSEKDFRS